MTNTKNAKANKAILINAKDNTVKFVDVGHYTDIYKHTGFETFTTVRIDAKGNTLYVDDEGLINGTATGFVLKGYDGPLMGNAVILGTNLNNGDTLDTDLTLEAVAGLVHTFKVVDFGNEGTMLLKNPNPVKVIA